MKPRSHLLEGAARLLVEVVARLIEIAPTTPMAYSAASFVDVREDQDHHRRDHRG